MSKIKILPVFVVMTFAFCINGRAQYVTLTDSNFVKWLSQFTSIMPCLNGNQLDTTCPAILNWHNTSIDAHNWPISNLDGVHYLKNLDTLYILGTPSDTTGEGLEQLTTLPLPIHLKYLRILGTKLSQLPPLSNTLLFLDCSYNKINNLPNVLPSNLTELQCSVNQLTQLPGLPTSLTSLWCDGNSLTSLPPLPPNLISLICGWNLNLIQPLLPNSLRAFQCYANGWSALPVLPNSLQSLNCGYNQLPSLAALPASLTRLGCEHNLLLTIPTLPNSLQFLKCNNNQLSTLPALPVSLKDIDCSYNQILSLPELPDYMLFFDCSNNANLRCLPELKTMQCGTHPDGFGGHDPNVCLNFTGTAVSCIPDSGNISYSTPSLQSLPLCSSVNPDNCTSYIYNSIKETASIHFRLFPNPCNDFVTITLYDKGTRTTIQVIDFTGKEVGNYSFQTSNLNLQTSNLSAGVYLLKLSNSRGETSMSKLVKQ